MSVHAFLRGCREDAGEDGYLHVVADPPALEKCNKMSNRKRRVNYVCWSFYEKCVECGDVVAPNKTPQHNQLEGGLILTVHGIDGSYDTPI